MSCNHDHTTTSSQPIENPKNPSKRESLFERGFPFLALLILALLIDLFWRFPQFYSESLTPYQAFYLIVEMMVCVFLLTCLFLGAFFSTKPEVPKDEEPPNSSANRQKSRPTEKVG